MCSEIHCIFNPVKSSDSLGNHLNNLLREADNRIHELSGNEDVPQAPFSTRASFSSIIGKFFCCLLFIFSNSSFSHKYGPTIGAHLTTPKDNFRLSSGFLFVSFLLLYSYFCSSYLHYIQPNLTYKLTRCVL